LRTRESRTRLQLDRIRQLRVLDLLVALEEHLIDDLVLRNLNHERRAGYVHFHIGIKPRCEKALNGFVNVVACNVLPRLNANLIADRSRIDAFASANIDIADDRSMS